jgi:hypothetical protein
MNSITTSVFFLFEEEVAEKMELEDYLEVIFFF